MEKLFDELGKFTEEGTKLVMESEQTLTPIFKKYVEKGYNVREVSHVIGFGLFNVENMVCLKHIIESLKKKQNEQTK